VSERLPRILCVDDEAHVLDGLSRVLRHRADVVTAVGGPAGLARLQTDRDFAVITSDLRMPGLDGTALLAAACRLAPDATRILLTGHADLRSAIAAINDGHIFRFLAEPCPAAVLMAAMDQAIAQHRLVTSERVLLEETLHGSVKALVDVLALASPVAFGRAARCQRLIGELAALIGFRDRWQMEMAAMLSQVGSVTLPTELAERYYHGRPLTSEERTRVDRLPLVALSLIAGIPRLDEIHAILEHVGDRFGGARSQSASGEGIPLGARLLRVVLDYDEFRSAGYPAEAAVERLEARSGWYDTAILADLRTIVSAGGTETVQELHLGEVEEGMIFVDDLRSTGGTLLVARGHEVTHALLHRIRTFWSDLEVAGPVRVTVPPGRPRKPCVRAPATAG
jgi:response regulator RpfG family c-di-GMP phosphodiesterase